MVRAALITSAVTLCAMAGCSATKPQIVANPSQPKIPVVVDTDMGFDDWMALLYLLNEPSVDVKAITIDCVGETYCPHGAINATRLIEIAGSSQIPVFFGSTPQSTLAFQFPSLIRYGATTMEVAGFEGVVGTPFYAGDAAARLHQLVLDAGKSGEPLTLLSIGSSTNFADAIELSKQVGTEAQFQRGIKRIFKGGGAVGEAVDGRLTNQNIRGNINIPLIFKSENNTAEWNIYPNAAATEMLIASGLPVTLIPLNLTDRVPITESSYLRLRDHSVTNEARFVAQVIIDNVEIQGGWAELELEYWDPSVVVSALHPDLVSEKYANVPVCVETSDGPHHGTTYIDDDEKCVQIDSKVGTIEVYTKISEAAFLDHFFAVLNGEL